MLLFNVTGFLNVFFFFHHGFIRCVVAILVFCLCFVRVVFMFCGCGCGCGGGCRCCCCCCCFVFHILKVVLSCFFLRGGVGQTFLAWWGVRCLGLCFFDYVFFFFLMFCFLFFLRFSSLLKVFSSIGSLT